jgi:hypothetical protein
MGARLRAVLDLQSIEHQIVDIRRQLARKERLVAEQQRKVDAARRALQVEREEVRRAQAEFDATDVEVKSRSGHIARLREHLNTVKTNKEYAAVLTQMNTEKADLTKFESRAMEMMERIEVRRGALSDHERQERDEVARLEETRAQLDKTAKSYQDRLAELQRQRETAIALLDRKTVELFERLSERYDGEVTAEVSRPNPRRDEFICGGCHMGLTAEVANGLLTRDDVLTCRSCGRILFMNR